MKNFFTSLLGALVALIIFTVGGMLLTFGVIGAIASLAEKKVVMESGSYLVIDLSAAITDAPPVVDFRALGNDNGPTLQMRTITRCLQAAATDNRIVGVFLKGEGLPLGNGAGYGALKEVRAALLAFRASGKPVKSYLSYATTKNFYLASASNEIAIDPYGLIIMPGLASQPMFFAGALEKYGVGIQVTRVGKYKSYVEPFTRKDMSPENREQVQKLLNDIWGTLREDIAKSRGVTPDALQAAVDSEGIIRADAARKAKLVDRVIYRDELLDELKRETGRRVSSKDSFKQIALVDYARIARDVVPGETRGHHASDKPGATGRIAVVYADGSIVDGEGDNNGEVGGTRFARELRRLRNDDSVKAIVLRVNSPGGSATAAETIQREVRLAKKVKPVIVSMGSYAASGGYWISAYGDRIFADPDTITGSIGVFGIQFDIQKLANDFGVTFDSVKTGKFADTFTIARPKTPEEMAVFQRMVDWIYDQFITKVSEARHLPREKVQEIAQGRVWSGSEALQLGLVDEMGGLDAAIRHAAKTANLGTDYRLLEYPRKKEFAEALREALHKVAPNNAKAGGLVGAVTARIEHEMGMLKTFNDPVHIYARMALDPLP